MKFETIICARELESLLSKWNVPGAAVVEVVQGYEPEILCAGFSDIGARKPVSTETLFPMTSGTKAFTAWICYLLEKRNALCSSLAIQHYLPELSGEVSYLPPGITLRDCLLHQTKYDNRHPATDYLASIPDRLRLMASVPPSDDSGPFNYQTLHYLLVGEIIRRTTGEDFNAHLLRELRTLGVSLAYGDPRQARNDSNLALGYGVTQGSIVRYPHEALHQHTASGGAYLTPTGIGRWLQCLLDDKSPAGNKFAAWMGSGTRVEDPTYLKLFHPGVQKVSIAPGFLTEAVGDHCIWSRYGNGFGFQTYFGICPNAGRAYAILTNGHYPSNAPSPLITALRNTLYADIAKVEFGDSARVASDQLRNIRRYPLKKPTPIYSGNGDLRALTGSYYSEEDADVIEIQSLNGTLILHFRTLPLASRILTPISEGRLAVTYLNRELEHYSVTPEFYVAYNYTPGGCAALSIGGRRYRASHF